MNEDVLKIVLNDVTFGKDTAAGIVGGRARLMKLCESGKIRFNKPSQSQNGKWFCNAYDVIKHASLNFNQQ